MSSDDEFDGESVKTFVPLALVPDRLNGMPTNGLEYIRQVMDERRKYRPISRCEKFDAGKFAKNQNVFSPQVSETLSAPAQIMPSIEWQLHQVADFSELRQKISALAKNTPGEKPVSPSRTIEDWSNFFLKNKPSLSVMLPMSQSVLEDAIDAILVLMQKGNSLMPYDSWIYSLMACLKLPLIPNLQSTLRSIAKLCSQYRSNLTEDENLHDAATPINLTICLIARYFQQTDLADEPNDKILQQILNSA